MLFLSCYIGGAGLYRVSLWLARVKMRDQGKNRVSYGHRRDSQMDGLEYVSHREEGTGSEMLALRVSVRPVHYVVHGMAIALDKPVLDVHYIQVQLILMTSSTISIHLCYHPYYSSFHLSLPGSPHFHCGGHPKVSLLVSTGSPSGISRLGGV